MTRTWATVTCLLLPCALLSCAAPEALAPKTPQDAPPAVRAAPSSSPSPSSGPATAAATVPAPSKEPGSVSSAALREDEGMRIERLVEANVFFLITGEDGRIAALAEGADGVAVHRFERGGWQSLALPAAEQTTAAGSALGIYFGRDNRLRLMGHRQVGGGRRMVYLRHRDGTWQDQRSEIGALAGDSSQLYGVLGEVDPEVVCKLGGICLLKSRKGWKEIPNTIPSTSVVRVFHGRGWALTPEGIFRAGDARGDGAFMRIGPPASWKSEATGFWVGDDGAIAVTEPGANAIHRLDAGAASWKIEPSPVRGPRDVFGTPADRWVCGDGGLAHGDGTAFRRVGSPSLRLTRWIATKDGGLAGGPSGVFSVRAGR